MINDKQIAEIEQLIGYTFTNKELLKTAFNHVSYANEHGEKGNDALEFLGDGVLNFVVADILYDKELVDEGQMTLIRSKVVSKIPLAREVERLKILPYLQVGGSFLGSNANSVKFVSNVYEAVVGAVYKDGGLAAAKAFIKRTLIGNLDLPKSRDYKTKLQELAQAKGLKVTYLVTELSQNPPSFKARVFVADKQRGEGIGGQKKIAEQNAARAALIKVK